MSSFKSKAALLKQQLAQQTSSEEPHQIHVLTECNHTQSQPQSLSLQQPIIIERKTYVKQEQSKQTRSETETTFPRRKVEPWVPISVPTREKKADLEQSLPTAHTQPQKEIEIQIERDDKGKDCLKKLFKKVRKLEEELKESEKERVRMGLELENYKGRSKTCNEHDRIIAKLEAEKYRIEVDADMLAKLLKEREEEITKLSLRAPRQIIKEVIVEKPVEVIVEVPRMVPGPERVVEKIVEVPKYIEVEKRVPFEVIKEVIREVVKTVEVPSIVEKPVYIQKPVYIDRVVEVQKRVEVPVEVRVQVPVEYPVYIEKPVVEDEWLLKIRELEGALENTMRENAYISSENGELRIRVAQLGQNLEMMRRHNEQKNREVEMLLQNSIDYLPFSPHHDISQASVKYSISSNPHPRVI